MVDECIIGARGTSHTSFAAGFCRAPFQKCRGVHGGTSGDHAVALRLDSQTSLQILLFFAFQRLRSLAQLRSHLEKEQ